MNIWIIPDLHGCAKTLAKLIEDKIRPLKKKDSFIFLGDYIDRGPDSKGVIDYIMQLEKEGFGITTLKGNHEEYLLLAYDAEMKGRKKFQLSKPKNKFLDEWMMHGAKSTLKSFAVKSVADIPERYISWIRNLRMYIELEKYVVVHAGLNFQRRDPFEDQHALLWTMSFEPEPEKIQGKTVIHGHVPVSFDFLKFNLNKPDSKCLPLDNGCFLPKNPGMGRLVALNLKDRNLLFQENIE